MKQAISRFEVVIERNGDISAVTAERLRPALVLVVRVPAKFRL